MILALSSHPFFFSIPTRRTTPIKNLHLRGTQSRREKPTISFRLLFDGCFNLLVSGVVVSSSFLSTNGSIANALGDPNIPLKYPCEDVAGYYSGIDGLEGAKLMRELGSLVSNHRPLSYKEVWNALMILDAADVDNPKASSDIIEIYSLRAVPKKLAGKPEGWNREHLWPRSYGLMDGPTLSDLHNLRPADVNVNSSRGNKYYGECTKISSHCLSPANREAAPDTETDKQRWAPPLQVRGDIARSLMYMAVCYGFPQHDGDPYLQLSDSPSTERREMGLISALLKWNELDPPSREEQLRNDRICRLYQHNRNPFVDHPEYANLIWKHASLSNIAPLNPSPTTWINELRYKNKGKDQNEFVEIVTRSSTDATKLDLILYNGANGRMYGSLSSADAQAFSVTDADSGIALVSGDDTHSEVVQFPSYEGGLKAFDGPARGMESVDIMVHENEGWSDRDSVGLPGQRVAEFKWRRIIGEASPGKPNIEQTIIV
ncbi:uncharacterized protein M6B38_361615 [Iris pallida]|uniref:Uncharacterized protein n=1 Tax=Iris pallida TaxID=29817 RepID=A0AAX6GK10_IRIPA|nr:uncharacterized protein M6B38_361615 [Iris pallida]